MSVLGILLNGWIFHLDGQSFCTLFRTWPLMSKMHPKEEKFHYSVVQGFIRSCRWWWKLLLGKGLRSCKIWGKTKKNAFKIKAGWSFGQKLGCFFSLVTPQFGIMFLLYVSIAYTRSKKDTPICLCVIWNRGSLNQYKIC